MVCELLVPRRGKPQPMARVTLSCHRERVQFHRDPLGQVLVEPLQGGDTADAGRGPCQAPSTVCSSSVTTHMDLIIFQSIYT